MPFTELLWHCLEEGKTSFRDKGTNRGAEFKPASDECVLVYHTDSAAFRKCFSLPESPASDAMFFFKQDEKPPAIVAVEIKSTDFAHAVTQLGNVIEAIRSRLGKYQASYYAVILLSSASPDPATQRRLLLQMSQRKVTLKIKTGVKRGHTIDIRKLLFN